MVNPFSIAGSRLIKRVFLILIPLFLLSLFSFLPTYAADGKLGVDPEKCNFTSGSGLLNLEGSVFRVADADTCSGLLADYMVAMINFFFRLAITLAVLMIAIGGFQWLMAIGNSSKIANAKDTIQQAVVGLIIAMTATLLFSQIDTSFTTFDKSQFDIIQLGAGDYTFCQTIEPSTFYFQAMQETGEDQVNPEVTAKATEIAEAECGKQSGRCVWKGGKCEPVLGAAGNLTQCSAPYYVNGCADSVAVTKTLECVKTLAIGVTLGQITTFDGTHTTYSCHFGGKSCKDGSHAIDFGNEDSSDKIINMVYDCTINAGKYESTECRCENAAGQFRSCSDPDANHIHCNIDVAKCDCN